MKRIISTSFFLKKYFFWAGRSAGRSLPSQGKGHGFKSRPVHSFFFIKNFLVF